MGATSRTSTTTLARKPGSADLDVFGIGPVVSDVSELFDDYWNHETALPLPAFADMPDDPAAELKRVRREMKDAREAILDTRYAAAVRGREIDFLDLNTSALKWSPYNLVYDSPDKGVRSRKDQAETIRGTLVEALESAQHELTIITPYFVPRESGIEMFSRLRERGIRVRIITNSLASQDQILVHSGYAPSRKRLLEQGVRLYEFRPVLDETIDPADKIVTLHTKAFIVDRKVLFVGSFNFDPRSAYINTEQGVILYSTGAG